MDQRLDRLLDEASAETSRLHRAERGLKGVGIAGLVITSVRGLIGIFAPVSSDHALPLGISLAVAIVLSLGLLALGFRTRRRLERHRHGAFRIELAREVLDLGQSVVDVGIRVAVPAPARTYSLPWRRLVAITALASALIVLVGLFTGGPRHSGQRWTFLEASTSPSELGLHSGTPRGGPWAVESHEHATGARALVNREGEEHAPPAILVAQAVWLRDFRAVTRCKASAARAVQQCGLVFRFRDESNYSVARLDSVDKSVALFNVVAGREHQLASVAADAPPNMWHELRLEAQAGVIRVTWNSRQLIEVAEGAPAAPGRIGLWVPAAGVAYFDELAVDGLIDSPRGLEVLPFLARSRS